VSRPQRRLESRPETGPIPGRTGSLAGLDQTRHMEQLLSAKEVVVACGPGGVGKTTISASLAATAAARLGGRVLVLTVDPARRLADALGVGGLGNVARRVPDEAFADAGARPKGELYAAMLDMSESWDALVRRHAPDPRTANEILANPLYRNITRRFAQGHDYIAMERLYELHEEGEYDLMVVDTPPSLNALDLLDAPGRMAEFFSSRLLRWLIVPYRSRFVNFASRPFYQIADRILGSQFLEDLAGFFILFQTMRDGFVARAEAVNRLLRDVRTTFVVVTTLEAVPAMEAEQLIGSLRDRRLHLGLLVCNKVLPGSFSDPPVGRTAELLGQRADELAKSLAGRLPVDRATSGRPTAEMVGRVLDEVARSFANFRLVATREAELLTELSATHEVTATVPYHPGHVTDLRGLLDVGAKIWGDESTVSPEASSSRSGRSARAGGGTRAAGGSHGGLGGGSAAGTSRGPSTGGSTEDQKHSSAEPESNVGRAGIRRRPLRSS
jgi:anion-transporting  ArsA/GET3 family ATPase